MEGLIHGGAYFLNFKVTPNQSIINYNQKNLFIRMPYFCNFVQVRVHVYFFYTNVLSFLTVDHLAGLRIFSVLLGDWIKAIK